MKVKEIGLSIARRTYFDAGDETRSPVVEIEVGKPIPSPFATGEFLCAFRVTEEGRSVLDSAFGIDEMQALLLALSNVKSHLNVLNEKRGGTLRWLGDEMGDLGLVLKDFSSK
jgi:hypothetical protein